MQQAVTAIGRALRWLVEIAMAVDAAARVTAALRRLLAELRGLREDLASAT